MFKKIILVTVLLSHACSLPLTIAPAMLEESSLAQAKKKISTDFARRDKLAKVSYGVLGAGLLWFAYQWGAFDFLLGKNETLEKVPEKLEKAILDAEHKEKLFALLAALHAQYQKNAEGKNHKIIHWIIEGVKYVGLTGVTMVAGILVQAKWRKFFDYALADATFDWFFSGHSIVSRVDALKYHVSNGIDVSPLVPQATVDYHAQAIEPIVGVILKNIVELDAFCEYYLEKADQDLVFAQKMDGAPRYLFNLTNDFLAKITAALAADNRIVALAAIDEFKVDLSAFIRDCQAFETLATGG